MELIPSGPIIISFDNQVIENLLITAEAGNGISGYQKSGVIIRNCAIMYAGGNGIKLQECPSPTIENVNLLHTGAPETGVGPHAERNGIWLLGSDNAIIKNILSTDPSTGIYLQQSDYSTISKIKCVNARGPFPRGQLIQFNDSQHFTLSDFYSFSDLAIAWTADNVSIYASSNGTIDRGIIDGNNRPNGSGVVTEHGSSNIVISDIDCYRWMNCAFGASNGNNIEFHRCKASDSYMPSVQGNPASGTGLMFIVYNFETPNGIPTTEDITVSECEYWNLHENNQIVWDSNLLIVNDITSNNFIKRIPINPTVPSITKGVQMTTVNLTGISSGNLLTDPITVSAVTDKPELFESITVNYTSPEPDGTIELIPITNVEGVALITVSVENDKPIKNIIEKSFAVTLIKLNLPMIDEIEDVDIYS